MTLYTVYIYREMLLKFEGIEATTPEEAAEMACDKPTNDAEKIEDCEGKNIGALVDVVGDDQHEQSVTINFEPQRLRKAARELL